MEFTVSPEFLALIMAAIVIGAIVSALTERVKEYVALDNIIVSIIMSVFVTEVVIFASLHIVDLAIVNVADHILLNIVVWAGANAIYSIFMKNAKEIKDNSEVA